MEPFRVTVLGPAPLLHVRPLGQGLYVCGTLLGQQSQVLALRQGFTFKLSVAPRGRHSPEVSS